MGQAFRTNRDAAIARRNELHAMKADLATPRFPKDDHRAPFRVELRGKIGSLGECDSYIFDPLPIEQQRTHQTQRDFCGANERLNVVLN